MTSRWVSSSSTRSTCPRVSRSWRRIRRSSFASETRLAYRKLNTRIVSVRSISSVSPNSSPYVGPSRPGVITSRGETRIRPRTSTDRLGCSCSGPTRMYGSRGNPPWSPFRASRGPPVPSKPARRTSGPCPCPAMGFDSTPRAAATPGASLPAPPPPPDALPQHRAALDAQRRAHVDPSPRLSLDPPGTLNISGWKRGVLEAELELSRRQRSLSRVVGDPVAHPATFDHLPPHRVPDLPAPPGTLRDQS